MQPGSVNHALEIARWVGIGGGVFFANYYGYEDPGEFFSVLGIYTVISIAGLTGLESVFFAKEAAKQSGYGYGGAYQRQSGLNNLAVAITAIVVWSFDWGIYAKSALVTVMLVFLTLSASNHAYTAFKEGNRAWKNMARPMMTAALLAYMVPCMWSALAAAK